MFALATEENQSNLQAKAKLPTASLEEEKKKKKKKISAPVHDKQKHRNSWNMAGGFDSASHKEAGRLVLCSGPKRGLRGGAILYWNVKCLLTVQNGCCFKMHEKKKKERSARNRGSGEWPRTALHICMQALKVCRLRCRSWDAARPALIKGI